MHFMLSKNIQIALYEEMIHLLSSVDEITERDEMTAMDQILLVNNSK